MVKDLLSQENEAEPFEKLVYATMVLLISLFVTPWAFYYLMLYLYPLSYWNCFCIVFCADHLIMQTCRTWCYAEHYFYKAVKTYGI